MPACVVRIADHAGPRQRLDAERFLAFTPPAVLADFARVLTGEGPARVAKDVLEEQGFPRGLLGVLIVEVRP